MSEEMKPLPLGKLDPEFLSELIEKYTLNDDSIVIGPRIGIDATVIDQGDHYLIAKTDPITFVADDIGYYAININANDIACMGGVPRWFLGTLLLPENETTVEMVRKIFSQISSACKERNIAFCGGHTEITYGIDRPILVGQMLGIVKKNKLVKSQTACPGDVVIITKGIAIEAVSIIAREKEQELIKTFSQEFVEKCKNFIYDPGISVLQDAQTAVAVGEVHAMHDPTEGGLAMGLYELAAATGCGIKVFEKEIPVLPEAKFLCDMYNLNILGVIASGALLIVVDRSKSHTLLTNLKERSISARIIGKLMPSEYGIKLIKDEAEIPLPEFYQDEITQLFK